MSRLELCEGVRKVVARGGKRERCVRAGALDLVREDAEDQNGAQGPGWRWSGVQETQGERAITLEGGPGDGCGRLNVLCVNPGYGNQYVSDAIQITAFRLDESGAKVESEAGLATRGGRLPRHFPVNCPFLLAMRTRGTDRPFFALWIENAELLVPVP